MRVRPLFALVLAAALGACSGPDEATVLVDDDEPNDTLAEATPIAIGTLTLGAISPPGDQDYYEFRRGQLDRRHGEDRRARARTD